jgi:catechol 2,3-dioxygenase-like lactoylglutathione lyase family enzyme
MRLNHVTVATHDVERAIAFYRALGLELVVRSSHYARFVCPEGRSTFSVHLTTGVVATSTVVYFECDDLDAKVAALEAAGLRFDSPPTDQPWLWREARLKDPDGNPVCLYFAGGNRSDPPGKVDASTRLA